MRTRPALLAAIAAALLTPEAQAVSLNPDGLGQALIYPYYTAQSIDGNAFNTYISVANHNPDAKAIRVRFREGRTGRETLSFNLFLAPNDMWTGAVVPMGDGTRLLTADASCTDPAFTVDAGSAIGYRDFSNAAFSGPSADGSGEGLDRTREGFVEMIEMAVLTDSSAAQSVPTSSPASCQALRDAGRNVAVTVPTGGLSGSLTLINVASGEDFTVNAEALANLTTSAFFRLPSDSYPGFTAAEITPVSIVVANGSVYRSTWDRGIDAVSAVLMRWQWQGEYVLDSATRSRTDWVITFPTRLFYTAAANAAAPFTGSSGWARGCASGRVGPGVLGQTVKIAYSNREERTGSPPVYEYPEGLPPGAMPYSLCATASVLPVAQPPPVTASGALGSTNLGYSYGTLDLPPLSCATCWANGWLGIGPDALAPLVSLPNSTRVDLATGQITTSAHTYYGLPVSGFFVRTFVNGTLACAEGVCQGNYGGAFPLRYTRRISTP